MYRYPPAHIRQPVFWYSRGSSLLLFTFMLSFKKNSQPPWKKNVFGNAWANCPYPSHPVHHSCFQWHTLWFADGHQNPFGSNRVQCESSWVSGSGWNYHINAICECWANQPIPLCGSVMWLPASWCIKLQWCHRWQSVSGASWVWGKSEGGIYDKMTGSLTAYS